jgi:hypothetical protein
MEGVAVNRPISALTNVVMSLPFFIFLSYLFYYKNIYVTIFFIVLFLLGFAIRRKQYFWKASFSFFSIMSILFSYTVFGGLEPNNEGVLNTGVWLNIEFIIFISFVSAAIAALLGGLIHN